MAMVNLPAELTTCSFCNNRFGNDLDSSNSNTEDLLNPRIPVQSQNCEHYFCFGCIQTNHTDNTTPWIKCLICDQSNAFQPANPIVYRGLTALLSLNIDIEQDDVASTSYEGATVVQEDGVKEESGNASENRGMDRNGNGTPIVYIDIVEDNALSATYGGATVLQEGLKQEADIKAENEMDMSVNATSMASIASFSIAHNAFEAEASGSENPTGNTNMSMTVNAAPIASIASSNTGHNAFEAEGSGSDNPKGRTDMIMSVNAAPIASITSSSAAHNVSESMASGSKRKLVDISEARRDEHNVIEIDVSPFKDSVLESKRKVEDISEARGYKYSNDIIDISSSEDSASGSKRVLEDIDEARDYKGIIDISSDEDSLPQDPHEVIPTRRQTFTVGTKLLKKFPIPYKGKVVKLPSGKDDKYYRVEYEDGDEEEYDFNELAPLAKMYNAKNSRKEDTIHKGTKVINIFYMAFEGEVVQVPLRGSKKYSLGGAQKYKVNFLKNGKIELITAAALRPLVEAYANNVLIDVVRSEDAGSESEDAKDEEINCQGRQKEEDEDIDLERREAANPEVENQGQHAILEGTMPRVAVKAEPMDVFKYNIETRRKYGDRVLLARQAKNGMMKLGGGNCGMDLFPKHSIKGNKNHPRFRDLGHTKAIAYSDLWQPDGPKYAGQECGHVKRTKVPDRRNPFSVFMRRTLKNGRDSFGWEYCGEYICTDPEGDVITWTSAHTLTCSERNKMITDIVSSCKKPDGAHVPGMEKWRNDLAAALLTDPAPATDVPLWMIEDRLPTSAELEDAPPVSLAARARAFGFRPGIPIETLAEIVVRLDEFRETEPIKFLSYDENVYNYVCKGETTKNSRAKKKRDGEPCAKASDWYAHFDQQIR